jgi:hypothetical protein
MKTLLIIVMSLTALAQDKSALAAMTGVVKVSRLPAGSVQVRLSDASGTIRDTLTDASGKFSFIDVFPGPATLQVKNKDGGLLGFEMIRLLPDRKSLFHFDFNETGTITGRITDENKKPIKGLEVRAISAEYAYGAVRYTIAATATTNESGDYAIRVPDPDRPHYIVAGNDLPYTGQPSTAAEDPAKRDPVLIPMYYPSARSIEEATPMTVAIGKRRELVDFQMKSTPSLCIEGMLTTPVEDTPVSFDIGQNDPPTWTINVKPWTIQHDPPGDDGHIRVCDLAPGHYWIKTYSIEDTVHVHGMEFVTIGDHDVTGIITGPQPQHPITGVVVWDVPPPADNPIEVALDVTILSALGQFGSTTTPVAGTLPEEFETPISNEAYVVTVSKIPDGSYLKDITYAGRSVLYELLEPGATPDSQGLRIVLARDAAHVSIKAVDKDGQPAPSANVAIFPISATTEAAAASAMIVGQTDASSTWTSGPIAPGKYYVIATTSPVNRSPTVFAKLWRARSATNLVELAPNTTAQLTRVPGAIE